MTKAQMHILRHSLGLDEEGRGEAYRNYYVCDPDPDCEALVSLGLMACQKSPDWICGRLTYIVTEAGKRAATEGVKPLSKSKLRYLEFLRVSDCCPDLTFKQFLARRTL